MYGCETWTLLKADEQKLEAFHMSCQCQILGVHRYRFVGNVSVINQTSVIFVNENENAKTAKLVTQRKC